MGNLSLKGTIKVINAPEQINEKLTKRTFVVETEEQYPQMILIEAINDKAKQLDKFSAGCDVIVGFNLRGREYTGKDGVVKYFNSISAWSINSADREEVTPDSPEDSGDENDDLPF